MSVTALFLSNLPHGITQSELKRQLVDSHPVVFDVATLQIEMYSSNQNNPVAVVKGIDCNFEKLLLNTRNLRIYYGGISKAVVLKPDAGDARMPDGKFQSRKTSLAKRQFIERAGLPNRKILDIFDANFLNSINTISYTTAHNSLQEDRMLCIDTTSINVNKLRLPGLNYFRPKGREGYVCVMFHSTLENIQAIAKLNFNPDLLFDIAAPLPQFVSADGRVRASVNTQEGLGHGGALIEIEQLSKRIGFIPFQEFNPALLNSSFLESVKSYCWRCKSAYNLLGVNLHLSTIAGRCSCDYYAYRNGGYKWEDENFTRLLLSKSKAEHKLEVSHYPVKQVYKDSEEYRTVMLPLLEEEWFSNSLKFKKENTTEALVWRNKLIDAVTGDKGRQFSIYATKLRIRLHKAWTANNDKCITRATLKWKGHECKSRICTMKQVGDQVEVVIRSKFLKTYSAMDPEDYVIVEPKQSKAEYTAMRKSLNQWIDNPINSNPLLQVLLNPVNCLQNNDWKLEADILPPRNKSLQNLILTRRLRSKLNNEQLLAMQRAKNYGVSFIHGPPGTGKTFTVAALTLLLSMQERGTIVLSAPSNFAADGMAISLNKLIQELQSNHKVIRMFSQTRAQQHILGDKGQAEKLFVSLHEEIRNSPKWLNDPNMDDLQVIAKNVNRNTEYLLSEKQAIALEAHQSQIMWEVIEASDIVVCTVGCLSDNRLLSFAKTGVISTVVVDEAGQLNHPSTLSLFSLNPKRLIFAGDNLQLTSTVMSFGASYAGLQMSLMDMIPMLDEFDAHRHIPLPPPWTTLVEQYRMHPQIRQLVSSLTYEGKLMDSPSVIDRESKPYVMTLEQVMDGSRLGMLDHTSHESVDPEISSYYNTGEVQMISDFVQVMMYKGVEAQDVTILTFYESQKKKLIEKLPKFVSVRNVDAYQGRENSIICVSFVRSSNIKTDIGFLNSINRINVALSRAQDFLFVAWNFQFFKKCKIRHIVELCNLMEPAFVLNSPKMNELK